MASEEYDEIEAETEILYRCGLIECVLNKLRQQP